MKTRYLAGSFPAIVHEEDRARYERHPLLGAYTDPDELVAAYDEARQCALDSLRVYTPDFTENA
jgi:hypothetical protein